MLASKQRHNPKNPSIHNHLPKLEVNPVVEYQDLVPAEAGNERNNPGRQAVRQPW